MDMPKLQYEAVITVPPLKITVPRRVRRVLVSDPNIDAGKLRGCYQVVMYYENVNEEEGFGWVLAGWIVESLGIALSENPMLAGRLQKKADQGEGGDTEMEIVSNDCGIRMAEARISIALSDFLESSDRHNLEHDLVFWKDIDEQSPEFSPLFYVQVTNFKCGGYSIGISCSLLLADFLVVDNFLKKWADIHKNEALRNGETKTPLFYHPRLKNPEVPPPNIIRRTPYKNGGQSLLFKITSEDSEFERESARLCVQEAEKRLQRKMGSKFSLFVKERSEAMKAETCAYNRQALGRGLKNQMTSTTWDEFGAYDISFHEEKKPVHVSRWIGSASEGNVVAVKYPKEGVSAVIVVTLAAENGILN
ncbi:tryptamine hydroxycinnamoyltransferase 2 [Neltuma alba]|uniref:tryptamine hydroxycinnamoyltransferase 2 n=1 Tax=Neltuma alba TaxID=207710 RepID=UPI0010A574FB|nr:tryptamine hydroxycinnamoyltransferase 2-like [Prosopis alba]XP_028762539.1 tryptamine hydroxycinnamoyltransferase 2-like [Prosopis alba]